MMGAGALALMVAAAACSQSVESRERTAARRAREEAGTRASETVRRAETPQTPTRLIYAKPTSLSDSNARRMGATIVGVDTVPQPTEPSVHSGPPPVKPRG
jgi:8-oxo-dGTP pyrophosphatase MutT (NUDIX family)